MSLVLICRFRKDENFGRHLRSFEASTDPAVVRNPLTSYVQRNDRAKIRLTLKSIGVCRRGITVERYETHKSSNRTRFSSRMRAYARTVFHSFQTQAAEEVVSQMEWREKKVRSAQAFSSCRTFTDCQPFDTDCEVNRER
ncbi:hypothetical protein RB195_000905 [Necator americanus]|uniref:Uncharacterized protein n=1 Tax=Necator americanus TaxID=51031 RepID=A0ABR1DCQ9_NECAM